MQPAQYFLDVVANTQSAKSPASVAPTVTFVRTFFSGEVSAFWPHVWLLGGATLGGIAVGIGIVLETPEKPSRKQRVAMWLVIIGIVVEPVCTLVLFAFDEGVSQAQQDKIVALETKLAPRMLSDEQVRRISSGVAAFAPTPYDAAVGGDQESFNLLGRIITALDAAKWDRKPWGGPGGPAIFVSGRAIAIMVLSGITVGYDPNDEERFGEAARTLAATLTKEGIPTMTVISEGIRIGQMRIWVGSKP